GACSPEPFLRFERDLHGGSDVAGLVWLDHREQPALVLYPAGNPNVRSRPIVAAYADIGQTAATRNKLLADLLVPKIDLHAISRIEPVIRPSLRALTFASNPTGEQIAVARITVHESGVEVEKSMAQRAAGRYIGVDTFRAEIELRDFRNM